MKSQSIFIAVEVERPFPVEVVKKLEIPVPKPYPVHVVYYNHISEDETPPPPPTTKATKPSRRPQSDYDFSSFISSFKLPNLMDVFMPSKKSGKPKDTGFFDFEQLYKNLLFDVPPRPSPARKKTSSSAKYGGEFSPKQHHEAQFDEAKPR